MLVGSAGESRARRRATRRVDEASALRQRGRSAGRYRLHGHGNAHVLPLPEQAAAWAVLNDLYVCVVVPRVTCDT